MDENSQLSFEAKKKTMLGKKVEPAHIVRLLGWPLLKALHCPLDRRQNFAWKLLLKRRKHKGWQIMIKSKTNKCLLIGMLTNLKVHIIFEDIQLFL